MANPLPLKQYLSALSAPDEDRAADLLARSLGADKPSPLIRRNIRLLLNPDTMANDAILTILSSEVAKKERSTHEQ